MSPYPPNPQVPSPISGGTLDVAPGGTASRVFFAGGGRLQLDALSQFGGVISGFDLGDQIDLRSLAYSPASSTVSWTQLTSGANASGALSVDEGGHVLNLTLLGQYSAANFNAGVDGHGGTLITDQTSSSSVLQTSLVAHQ